MWPTECASGNPRDRRRSTPGRNRRSARSRRPADRGWDERESPFPLGDIAISIPYAQRQALLRGVSLADELTALIVHGVLHLVGYDDETEADKLRMQQRMNEVGEMIGTPIDAFWTSVLHQNGEEDGE